MFNNQFINKNMIQIFIISITVFSRCQITRKYNWIVDRLITRVQKWQESTIILLDVEFSDL
jgi:hypothetical protein